MHVNVSGAVNKYLVERAFATSGDRDYSHFHPSEWDKCHRRIAYAYYEANGFIKIDNSALKISAQLERIFDNGHFMHDRWRGYVEASGALLGRWQCANIEVHKKPKMFGDKQKHGCFRPKLCDCGSDRFVYHEVGFLDQETMWGGHVDAIIDLNKMAEFGNQPMWYQSENTEPSDRLMIIDFKSIKPFSFSPADIYSFKKLTAPLKDHITQVQIYLYLSGLSHAKVLYECKGTQSVKEYHVLRDDQLIAQKKKEVLELKGMVTGKNGSGGRELPARAHADRSHRDCMQCKFRSHCWDERHEARRKTTEAPSAVVKVPAPRLMKIGESDV